MRPRDWRRGIPWALLVLAAFLMGPTWPRDDTGVPAPPCSFIGSGGTLTLCSTTDPLPTGAGTTSTTDPTGWGKAWFTSTVGNLVDTAALFANEQTVFAFDVSGGGPRTWVSTNAGRTFALQNTSPSLSLVQTNAAVRTTSGNYLIGANNSAGNQQSSIASSSSGFQFIRVTPLPTPCEPANGLDCNTQALGAQGTTVLAGIIRGASGVVCRSTNSGASFGSCTTAGFGGNGVSRQGIVSPSASIWLVGTVAGNVLRSTDDGVTFTTVLNMAGTTGNVRCLDATRCLATNGSGTIWRSTNAGATWATVIAVTPSPGFQGFADFGNGLVDAMGTGAPAQVFRSTDFGATWSFQTTLPNSPGSTGYATLETRNGRGVAGGDFGSDGVSYSPVVGAGETIVAGQNGARWEIDPNGAGEMTWRDPTTGTGAGVTTGGRGQVNAVPETGTNSRACSTPAANTAATITVTGVVGQQVHVLSLVAFYATAPAAAQVLTVLDGATTVWRDVVNGANTPTRVTWGFAGIQANVGATVVLTLPAGGAGVSGSLCATVAQFAH